MAAEIKYRVNNQNDVWLTDDVYRWNLPNTTLSMLWVDVIADGDITVVEQKKEDWCRFGGRDDKGDFYRYWFSFINNSEYERRNEYEFSTTVGDETASFTLKIIQKGTLPTPTTAENLNRIIQAKSDIKQAIENKGVTVGDMTIDGYAAKINEIPQEVTGKWVIPNGMKFGQSSLTNIDIENMDFSNVIDMGYMFDKCSNLTSLDLSSWDTSKVTTMQAMFFQCDSLTEIKGIENWDTSNVTNMNNMFSYCSNLTSFDFLKNWDTSNVTDMSWMFMNCFNLTSLDLSNWDTSNVTDMSQMFYYCSNLTELKMGGDVSKVRRVDYMFNYITTTGTFYYNPQYDYNKIIAALPSTWTAVPME